MKSDIQTAMDWFDENVISLYGAKGLSVVYTQEGAVLLLVTEENDEHCWMTALWTNFMGETGYERFPRHKKWVSPRICIPPVDEKPWWKFWA